jgi:hypothetical protein
MTRRLKWTALALLVANEIRGIIVVAAIGPAILRGIWQ